MRNYWIKVASMVLALAGVLWAMKALRDESTLTSANNPMQILVGGGQSATHQGPIPAKVKIDHEVKASK